METYSRPTKRIFGCGRFGGIFIGLYFLKNFPSLITLCQQFVNFITFFLRSVFPFPPRLRLRQPFSNSRPACNLYRVWQNAIILTAAGRSASETELLSEVSENLKDALRIYVRKYFVIKIHNKALSIKWC